MSSIKSPPIFNPDEDDDYASWKNDVEVWQAFTKEDAKRHGPAVYLSLKGKAREAVRGIAINDLKGDNGVKVILEVLDSVFLSDLTTRAYHAFKEFVEYRRSSGDSFSTFIVEYEKHYREVKKYNLELPTGVQAFFLLQAANLSSELEKLARATAKLEYADMKVKLQNIFGDSIKDSSSAVPIKEEAAYYTHNKFRGRGRGQSRGGSTRGRRNTNPKDNDGNVMRCHICESTKHFAMDCPHREKTEEAHCTVNVTLITGKADSTMNQMLAETLGKGILDSACTKTVSGEVWMKEFINNLNEKEKQDVIKSERPGNSLFRFGDGVESKSTKCVKIPVRIGSKFKDLSVEVVKNDIPLLIGKPTMSDMGMKIDFANHSLMIGKEKISLSCNSSGHYCMPLTILADETCNVIRLI